MGKRYPVPDKRYYTFIPFRDEEMLRVNVLLLSMPDSFEHMPVTAVRMPNGALVSLAGNVDPHHRVAVADLILVQGRVRETVTRLVDEYQPDVLGLSVMTFQRKTAFAIVNLVRALRPGVRVVVGGYDPSLATDAYTDYSRGIDFIVRGEGELTFRELLRAIENQTDYGAITGLSYRGEHGFAHNPDRQLSTLEGSEIRLPARRSRVLKGYTLLGRQSDVIETSRGCTFDCSFCSIIEMRGRNFNKFSFDRVLADIRDARDHGARSIFIVDDNLTLNIKRFEALCHAIVEAGLNTIDFTVQAMTSAIADHGETLAPLMRKAGFRYVFLGIENVVESDLSFLHAASKNTKHENGKRAGNAALTAIEHLHRNNMYVLGGLIVGNPEDTRESVQANLQFARKFIDWPYIQHPTPYPRTPMTKALADAGLIASDRLEEYDGTTSVVKCANLSGEEIEFMRWKAERWIKARHWWTLVKHDPLFMARNIARIAAFNFRGSSMKTFLGLEDEQEAFVRYRGMRATERSYV
jgi:anaerobic magnesium-protoporphyrin IX monomethyl ester cyclase